ncbi:ankyrin repeat-containing domain protein [Stachybotrys elegans]|uniref:Ankyrin repeat-containing domain protein n=1 Tax=Stachybotrys elegans TaxID=80388 RepID=A0A8K0SUX7_9HYPO|nr:ankyrin repeat-containing domain protein [Stachybotrys elegans]
MSTQHGMEVLYPIHNPDQPSPRNINIDIIAVPGLGADPSKSFGSETSDFNWLKDPKDGIPDAIPGARVLLYHYDSRWLGSEAKQQTLYNVASLLLTSLAENRKNEELDEPRRPLVFLAHSMGGLVVAKALTLAAAKPEEVAYTRILDCFAGGIFFGTPFKGSSATARALLLASLLEQVNGGAIPNQMLQTLDPERDSLNELRRDFVQLAFKEPKASITCIYEQEPTNYLQEKVAQLLPKWRAKFGPREIVVTEDSATLDGTVPYGFGCNHRQLNRFDTPKDGRYDIVRNRLKEIVKSAELIVKARLRASRQSVVDDDSFNRLAQSLSVVDVTSKLRSAENLSGDSNWILDEPDFVRWRQDPYCPCLWVAGDEGLGKSKAAAVAINTLREEQANLSYAAAKDPSFTRRTMVAYFFCDSSPGAGAAENVVQSLIWQLILQKRALAQHVKMFAAKAPSARGGGSGGQFSIAKLWQGLTDMLLDASVSEVYFVIANIHSLEENDSRIQLLDAIAELLQGQEGSKGELIRQKTKWMFLSRDRPEFSRALEPEAYDVPRTLKIDLNNSSKSLLRRQFLATFTRGRVKELADAKGYSLALQYFVFSSLAKRAESNTLWVDVVCSLLMQLPADFISVRKALQLLPQDVSVLIAQAWAKELEKSEDKDLEIVKEILRTLVVAYEDPTLEELSVLAELGFDLDADDAKANILEQIRACGPLVKVHTMETWNDVLGWTEESRVSFIHPVAKKCLLEPDLGRIIGLGGDEAEVKTEFEWQHGIVGLRCFSYLISRFGHDELDDDLTIQGTATVTTNQTEAEIDELFMDNEAEEEAEEEEEEIDARALVYPLKYWLKHGYDATPDFVHTLDISRRFWSLDSAARRRWWGNYATTDGQGELKNLTALHVASFFGLLPLVDSLLADGHWKEIHQLDSWDNQPLHWAAAKGHLKVCKRLLEKGADINNGRETKVWTPLHMAASEGRVETDAAKLLLERGADPTLTAEDEEPPVAIAILRGYEDLVEQLLQRGGYENLGSKDYVSALGAAASTGSIKIVQRLLNLDHDLASRKAALEFAAAGGFPDIIALILDQSASLSLGKALEKAAIYGQDSIVQQLWDARVDNELYQEDVNNALYHATDEQQESIVRLLLERCSADANATGEEYGNALTAAAHDGTMPIIKMLLQHGADLSAPEGYPLHTAAANGHTAIVSLFLDMGADPNSFTSHCTGGTALQEACIAGNTDTARVLLERGANPNHGAGELFSPLTAATYQANGDLVELLLARGADSNYIGGPSKSSPLINAAGTLQAKYVTLLLRYRANMDYQDEDGDTALMACAALGDDDCVQTLIDHGAGLNIVGAHWGTALHAAAAGGYAATCRLLLKHGANPEQLGGPYLTAIQAAAASGDPDCVKALLDHAPNLKLNVYGGTHYSALHAAAVQDNDKCLRQLLERGVKLDVVPKPKAQYSTIGTPLHQAAAARCNRNARLLLEAGADPTIEAGKFGTVIQAAALKADSTLIALLLTKEVPTKDSSGKYGSALVAAVAREGDGGEEDRHEIINQLLECEDLPAEAFKAALERALKLRRKEDFKVILTSYEAKSKKNLGKFPTVKRVMGDLKKAQQRKLRTRHVKNDGQEPANSDFGDDDYTYQDIDDVAEEEPVEPVEATAQTTGSDQTTMAMRGAGETPNGNGFGDFPRGFASGSGGPGNTGRSVGRDGDGDGARGLEQGRNGYGNRDVNDEPNESRDGPGFGGAAAGGAAGGAGGAVVGANVAGGEEGQPEYEYAQYETAEDGYTQARGNGVEDAEEEQGYAQEYMGARGFSEEEHVGEEPVEEDQQQWDGGDADDNEGQDERYLQYGEDVQEEEEAPEEEEVQEEEVQEEEVQEEEEAQEEEEEEEEY